MAGCAAPVSPWQSFSSRHAVWLEPRSESPKRRQRQDSPSLAHIWLSRFLRGKLLNTISSRVVASSGRTIVVRHFTRFGTKPRQPERREPEALIHDLCQGPTRMPSLFCMDLHDHHGHRIRQDAIATVIMAMTDVRGCLISDMQQQAAMATRSPSSCS